MLDTLQSMTLLTIVEIIGPIVLAAGLIYGIYHSRPAGAACSRPLPRARSTHRTRIELLVRAKMGPRRLFAIGPRGDEKFPVQQGGSLAQSRGLAASTGGRCRPPEGKNRRGNGSRRTTKGTGYSPGRTSR